ncbi:transcription elongation factor GreA [Parasphaerochaeta coccoides]|uniref:Transcription elongation factor GreA n=1 Tax=Parasphaerochaeta coccoides (strain ATCC BAA-1237 / DSM 17374 / SPN1) TaxID=760011 RepID=F4GK61_PARC1|nr:transcription elongation factor GreA [Parasphaerochaeta coccoides]AEC01833.1 Transcription elongation factor, GreA/GreB, N-terminal protein [Parasphaerochaeta coccoides DSM 17374]
MAEHKIMAMLTAEKWTRTTLANYTISNFHELDDVLSSYEPEELTEVKDACKEYLAKNKNSVIAMYIAGTISIEQNPLDDTIILQLAEMFQESKKWNIVEFLCEKILKASGENRYALRALATCYEATNREDEKFSVWERLVKVDYDEIEIVEKIARHHEAKNDLEAACFYYKRAINRYINAENFPAVKELWTKFLTIMGDDFGYLLGLTERVRSHFDTLDRTIFLLKDLNEKVSGDVDKRIIVLKRILELEPLAHWARTLLVDAYKTKYTEHGRLAACMETSGILQNYRDVHTAIEDFEKNISFDTGTFVFHKTWNIGRIRSIDNDRVIIDFSHKRNHEMSISMAFSSLLVLPKTHLWVLKSVIPTEKLAARFKTDIVWSLNTLLSSHAGQASFKEMKEELVPSILTAAEWSKWMPLARKELMNNPLFGISATDSDTFTLRNTPISFEEKQYNIFKSERNFYDKVRLVREFIESKGEVESDSFMEMISYFNDILANTDETDDKKMSSFLLLDELRNGRYHLSFIRPSKDYTFEELYLGADNIVSLFKEIKDSELNKSFITQVMRNVEDWPQVLVSLFPYYLTTFILDKMKINNHKELVYKILRDSVDAYKEFPEQFLYLARTYAPAQWELAGISHEKLLIAELQLLDYTYLCIENKKDVTENRKYNKQLHGLLFEDGTLMDFIKKHDADTARRVYSLLQDINSMEMMGKKIEFKHVIGETFSDYAWGDADSRADTANLIPTGLLCTQASLDAKRAELDKIMNIDIPEVAKEIGEARELGDLRENSEYKYGKEKQTLLNAQIKKLLEEIDRAQVIQPGAVDTSKTGFGTRISLHDNIEDKDVVYTLMGPWESEPSKNILSFQAPLGTQLMNKTVGQNFSFEINDKKYDFTVLKIERHEF